MSNTIKHLLLLLTLVLMAVGQVRAQTFTTLYSFSALDNNSHNGDGANPSLPVMLGNTLYGTARYGGSAGSGAIFAFNTTSLAFTNLYSFNFTNYVQPVGVIVTSNLLYGTALGGANGSGMIFDLDAASRILTSRYDFALRFTNQHSALRFENSNGFGPSTPLISSGNFVYGATYEGGTNGSGTIYAFNVASNFLQTLHHFGTLTADDVPGFATNSDGWGPGSLVLSGTTLYGTALEGNPTGCGTVFALNTNGTGFRLVYAFTNGPQGYLPGPLMISGNRLYGTANGGPLNGTTIFAVNTNGTGFTNLYNFPVTVVGGNTYYTYPGGLISSGNTLYGVTTSDGTNHNGTVFALNTNGTGFTNLHVFSGVSDGIGPGGLILSGNTLYGTTYAGGTGGSGTIFSIELTSTSAPQIALTRSGTNVILSWPGSGYTLQSTTDFTAPDWINLTGQNTVTNSISGTRKFYRLSQ